MDPVKHEFKRRLVNHNQYEQYDQYDQYDQYEEDEEIDRLLQRSKRLGINSPERLRRRPLHLGAEDYDDSSEEENKEKELIKKNNKDELLVESKPISSWNSFIFVFITIAVVVIAATLLGRFYLYGDMPSIEPELADLYHAGIAPYREQFPSQSSELWGSFFAGIQLTSSSNRLSVFLITHDASTNTSCLAQALGRVSANLLNRSSQPLIVLASDLDPSENFRQSLSGHRAIVVEELQKMPVGQNEKMFLYGLADTENPIVPGIAVVLTLEVHEQTTTMSAARAAELELERIWDWIDSESRYPLIVRVTGGLVYKMASEKKVINC